MKKHIFILLLALGLAYSVSAQEGADATAVAAKTLGGESTLKKQSLKKKFVTLEDLGVENEVLAAWKSGDGYVILTRVHYGTEYYEDPAMEVFVAYGKDGMIRGVTIGETVDHTPAYLEMVTEDYLASSFTGQEASYTLTADAVSGATYSSTAVIYGIRSASWYAANVFRIGERESKDVELKQIEAFYPGTYEKLEVDAHFSSEYGSILYAAEGTDADGRAFYVLLSQASFTPQDPLNNMASPTYQIWIDRDSSEIFLSHMLSGRFYEGFEMQEEKLLAYSGIPIETGEEFTDFTEGLITDAPEYIVTSATQSFPDTVTGATVEGNDTSLAVRCCMITAAQYYANVLSK